MHINDFLRLRSIELKVEKARLCLRMSELILIEKKSLVEDIEVSTIKLRIAVIDDTMSILPGISI